MDRFDRGCSSLEECRENLLRGFGRRFLDHKIFDCLVEENQRWMEKDEDSTMEEEELESIFDRVR